MKKSFQRGLCAALMCSLAFTLVAEQAVRLFENGATATTLAQSVAFENVMARLDTTTLREQNFNSKVIKAENATMLSGESLSKGDTLESQLLQTQPYSICHNGKYVLPMGNYVYRLDEKEEEISPKEKYFAVSRYKDYEADEKATNYISSTEIKGVYDDSFTDVDGVKYELYDAQTGELIVEENIRREEVVFESARISQSVALALSPEAYALVSNGRYRADFYELDDSALVSEGASSEKISSFSFTVDYEAPILESVRVRYVDYKEEKKNKQKIYLDMDVYDNHYAQAIMLCYPQETTNAETGEKETQLRLATQYPTPVRNAVENGTTTVSIEITDIYQEYGDQLYLLIDDYALNSCLYQVDIASANAAQTPTWSFELAAGEENITLDLYETHKVALNSIGSANLSNYVWRSVDHTIADVRNGEIVGLKAGKTTIFVSDPDRDLNKVREIKVTVTEEKTETLVPVPTLSFGSIKTGDQTLQNATGAVSVWAGETFSLSIEKEPWYHPMTNLSLKWSSTDESVATIDENGVVSTFKKGMTLIGVTVLRDGVETQYCTNFTLRVKEAFDVSNFTLNAYHGLGYNQGSVADGTDILVIPADMQIKYIGKNAFKDNENVRCIVIPASVKEIHESAFENCKALEEVYFVSEKHRQTAGHADDTTIELADLSLISSRAFYRCKALKKVDFSNVKTVALDQEVFLDCDKLEMIVDMPSIGSVAHRAFKNCVSLKSVDISRLLLSGDNVFENCVSLHTIITDAATAIGKNMFVGCVGLREKITLYAAKIGDGAFAGCVHLKGVAFQASDVEIGDGAFKNCGTGLQGGCEIDFNEKTVRSIGNRAFEGAKLASENQTFALPNGLIFIGERIFEDCQNVKTVLLGDIDFDSVHLRGAPFKGLNVIVAQDCTNLAEEQGVIYAKKNGVASKIVYVNDNASNGITGVLDLSASGVTEIVQYAFADVDGIEKVILPAGLTTIGEGAFAHSSILDIHFNGAQITEIPAWAFVGTKLRNIQLPQSVSKIGASAFLGSTLQSIVTEGESALVGVVNVGDYAFAASALRSITFADDEQTATFGDGVFADAKDLQSVTLPSMEALGESTFRGAVSIKRVVFGTNSITTGDYTFAGTAMERAAYCDAEPLLEGVTLRAKQTSLGKGLFYNASQLTEIAMDASLKEIGDYAFYGAEKLITVNLERVEKIGDYAFFNTALTTLDLASVKSIGAFAFSASKQASYASISIPTVETIGAFAFFRGAETIVALPQSVKEIGMGAFASSENLKAITFADLNDETLTQNDSFFVDQGVLYRYLNEEKTRFTVLCYPAALEGVVPEGGKQKQYKMKEGTVRVEAYSFYDLNAGVLNLVVLPYSVKTIGDVAFYASGVKEYTFESIQAPVLEADYRANVEQSIEGVANTSNLPYYKGYHYANFQTHIYNYTPYAGKTSDLIINYPSNGKGYDSYIYRLYFGKKNVLDAMMNDDTRACLGLVGELKDAQEVATWLNWNAADAEKKAIVEAFATRVKEARASYNNVIKDEKQVAFFGEENTAKLLAIEAQLREVKAHFNIPVYVTKIAATSASAHKATYTEGEKFDWTGLVITATYDDGSTVEITPESGLLTLKEDGVTLTPYHSYVVVEYTENAQTKAAHVVITVNKRVLSSIEKYPEEANVMRNVLIYGGAAMMVVGGIGVLVMVVINKRKRAKMDAETLQK